STFPLNSLNFANTVGLVGTREFNGKVEKADLGILTVGQGSEGRRYAFTTDLSDAEFESIVRNWRNSVLSGNRKAAARYTHFPLRVNERHMHRTIRTAEALSKAVESDFQSGIFVADQEGFAA